MLALAESQGSGWTGSPRRYFVATARLSPFTNKRIIIIKKCQLSNVHFQKWRGVPACKSFNLCCVWFRQTVHGSTGSVGLPQLHLLPEDLSLSIKGLALKPPSARGESRSTCFVSKQIPFLCNHKPERKGNSDQSQVTGNKSIVTVGEDREEAGKAMGSTGGTARSGYLFWRNNVGRKLEGVLDFFLSVPK